MFRWTKDGFAGPDDNGHRDSARVINFTFHDHINRMITITEYSEHPTTIFIKWSL